MLEINYKKETNVEKESTNMKKWTIFDTFKVASAGLAFIGTIVGVIASKGNEQTLEEKIDARVQAALTEKAMIEKEAE